MVSFNCDGCNDVIKKPKLDQHYQRCYASVTCLDCNKQFNSPPEWKTHTTCISEAEKYEKSVYRGNGKKGKDKQEQTLSEKARVEASPAKTTEPVVKQAEEEKSKKALAKRKSIDAVEAETQVKSDKDANVADEKPRKMKKLEGISSDAEGKIERKEKKDKGSKKEKKDKKEEKEKREKMESKTEEAHSRSKQDILPTTSDEKTEDTVKEQASASNDKTKEVEQKDSEASIPVTASDGRVKAGKEEKKSKKERASKKQQSSSTNDKAKETETTPIEVIKSKAEDTVTKGKGEDGAKKDSKKERKEKKAAKKDEKSEEATSPDEKMNVTQIESETKAKNVKPNGDEQKKAEEGVSHVNGTTESKKKDKSEKKEKKDKKEKKEKKAEKKRKGESEVAETADSKKKKTEV